MYGTLKKVILEDDDAASGHVLVAGGAPDAAQSVTSPLEDVERRSNRMSGEGGTAAALSAEMNKAWRLYHSQVTLFIGRHLQQHPSRHTLAQTRRLVPPINTDTTLPSGL